jgi:ectoine hydroxylase-related dioxygenase (phytanoyl-CoA dioxygenase family)
MRPLVDSAPIAGDAAALRARAEADGYLLLRGIPGPAAVAPLADFVRRTADDLGLLAPGAALAGTGYDDPRWLALQRRVLPDPRFLAVGDDPALLAVLETILGEPPMTRRGDICRLALPGAPHLTTPPHQDHYYTGGTTRIWTGWIPLADLPLDLGPLAVRPGSHRAGLLPHRGEGAGRQGVDVPEEEVFAASPLAAGDSVLFHSLTVHRALPNRTADRVRLSVDFRYQPASEPVHVVRLDGTRAGAG